MSKILVVDDDPMMRRLFEARLQVMGHEVFLAVDGEEGFSMAEQILPDLILLDAMMPKLSGFATAEKLRQTLKTRLTPILMVTALEDVQHRVRALDAGVNDFLSKPVDPSELKARVHTLLKVKAHNDHMQNYSQELETAVAAKTKHLKDALEKLEASSLDTILRLAHAAELRDDDAREHLHRVSHYAAAMSRQMGQPDAFSDMLLFAVPMHDIGKIGIPDRILLKAGPLDDDEWKVMRKHPEIGAAILAGADSEVLQLAEAITISHHEKWDGTGYPHELKGTAIPLAARITAVADVFDALSSKRPYKDAFPFEKSSSIIRSEAGKHFDPAIVDCFLAIQPEILAISTRFQSTRQSHLISLANLTEPSG